jgi:endoglucanase
MFTTTKKSILHLAVLMATVGVTGCGSDSNDSGSGGSSLNPPTPPVVKTPAATTPAPTTTTPPPTTTTTPTDTAACTPTAAQGAASAATAADSSAYSAATSEAANPNVLVGATVKPSAGGALQVKTINCLPGLAGKDGKAIQLRGMSTGGLQWHADSINDNAFKALGGDWGANVVRLAMYVGEGGYASKPELYDQVVKGIDLAIANDMYVIVDWHVLTPGDPNDPVYAGASDFFKKIATKYPNNPNIIYELANEPNPGQAGGSGVTNDAAGWTKIKNYATPIIKMLRDSGNQNLVVVGTPNWSQRPDLAAADPIADSNTMYTAHFYSATHKPSTVSTDRSNVMSNARYALEHGAGVFVTEWGVSAASGTGTIDLKAADQWLDFLNKYSISWANWQLDAMAATNPETSSALAQGISADPGADLKWDTTELSDSGNYVRTRIKGTSLAGGTPAPTATAFNELINDWNDGQNGGWGLQPGGTSDRTPVVSGDTYGLKLTPMTKSNSVDPANFWPNVAISGDGMPNHPNILGATTMSVDVLANNNSNTVSLAAVLQYGPNWTNPTHAVLAKPEDFVKQPNGKYKATIKITAADSPTLGEMAADPAKSTLTNIIMYVGSGLGQTIWLDNISISGTHPAK